MSKHAPIAAVLGCAAAIVGIAGCGGGDGPTEPRVQELKFYAPGVGPILSIHTDGSGERVTLVSFTPGD